MCVCLPAVREDLFTSFSSEKAYADAYGGEALFLPNLFKVFWPFLGLKDTPPYTSGGEALFLPNLFGVVQTNGTSKKTFAVHSQTKMNHQQQKQPRRMASKQSKVSAGIDDIVAAGAAACATVTQNKTRRKTFGR